MTETLIRNKQVFYEATNGVTAEVLFKALGLVYPDHQVAGIRYFYDLLIGVQKPEEALAWLRGCVTQEFSRQQRIVNQAYAHLSQHSDNRITSPVVGEDFGVSAVDINPMLTMTTKECDAFTIAWLHSEGLTISAEFPSSKLSAVTLAVLDLESNLSNQEIQAELIDPLTPKETQ